MTSTILFYMRFFEHKKSIPVLKCQNIRKRRTGIILLTFLPMGNIVEEHKLDFFMQSSLQI